MFSSIFFQHYFAINVSSSFVMFKVLASRFVSGSISIQNGGIFCPFLKKHRFPGHGVLLNNLFQKIK